MPAAVLFCPHRDAASPVFNDTIPIKYIEGTDQHLMFSIYHVGSDAAVTAEDMCGAATTTMLELAAATPDKPLQLQVLRDDAPLADAELTLYVS